MQTHYGLPFLPVDLPVFLTIGNFDGVHRGHQMLIDELARAARAAGGLAGLLTFDPHPLAVLRPDATLARLTSTDERADLLAALGLDFVWVLRFTRETVNTSAEDFMRRVAQLLPLRELWIGPDFALGRDRAGNAARLAELGSELGYAVRVVSPFDLQGEPVRSSHVRSLLAEAGAVDQAAVLLGRPYQVWGEVVRGAGRGHRLGFPTANLVLPADRLVPAFGVYACWAWLGDLGHPAVVNIGVRPSFDNGRPSVEAHLLGFDRDLYGEWLGLSFVRRLRGEQRFAAIDELIAQIGRDAAAARGILADPPDHVQAGAWGPDADKQFWTELPHTADWAIRVEGGSQRQLFARAAAAMFGLQDADPARPIERARAACVFAGDPAELMVAWLNRLLLGQEVDGVLYTRFEIQEISPRGLRGTAYGYRGSPTHTAVKAVTYYDLDVRETATGWSAQVTFDV